MNKDYILVKKFLSDDVTNLLFEYTKLKKRVTDKYLEIDSIEYNKHKDGFYNDNLVPKTFSCYSDIIFETLLEQIKPKLEEITNLKLTPTYSYWRLYKNDDDLKIHKDKIACEISTTICLGYDSNKNWPIYFSKNFDKSDAVEMITEPGDLVIYKGCKLWHWRDKFEGNLHSQAFLHFNDVNNDYAQYSEYDCRPFLGLPENFRNDYKLEKAKELTQKIKND